MRSPHSSPVSLKQQSDLSHATHKYAQAVADGKIVCGRLVRAACERHLTDLERGHERGLWFDGKAADLAFGFFGLLRLSKGRWKNPKFVLQPWQQFMVGSMFGWKREDGLRRFREVHLEVARKNGKTETAAAVALKLVIADGEEGAEVYCLATKRDQAKTTFEIAKKMAGVAALKPHLRRLKTELRHEATASKLEPLGADADTLDSLNVSGAIKDELHAWKSRDLWDVIDTATGARSQPLGLSTTTAGHNRRSIWWERRELCVKLLERVEGFENDELFPLIYTPDEGDDWENPAVWSKGNPSLGVIVQRDELSRRLREAKQQGRPLAFRRLRLNQPTETAVKWLDMAKWRRCADPVDESVLWGRPCYGGLDLSTTTDLTGWALWFPPIEHDRKWRLLVRHFLPKEDLDAREFRDKVPYGKWADGVRLTLSEGSWVDYGLVKKRIRDDAQVFRLMALAYDNRFAPSLIQDLIAEGFECVPWNQGPSGVNTGTKELYRMTLAGEMAHQGCPLLEWEAENTAVKETAEGYQRPDKSASSQRIDGIAAAISGLSLAIEKNGAGPVPAGIVELDLGGW